MHLPLPLAPGGDSAPDSGCQKWVLIHDEMCLTESSSFPWLVEGLWGNLLGPGLRATAAWPQAASWPALETLLTANSRHC